MKIEAVLFDKDGTLLDFEATYGKSTQNIIHLLADGDPRLGNVLSDAVGFDLNSAVFQSNSVLISGTTLDIAKAWQSILGFHSIDDFAMNLDQMAEMETINSVVPFEFTLSVLHELTGDGLPLGIATNDTEKNARDHITKISAAHYFSFFAGYDSGFGQKPGPGMVEAYARYHDLAIETIAMVGDSLDDMAAAKSAGAMAIGVNSGPPDSGLPEAACDALIDDISKLPDFLRSL